MEDVTNSYRSVGKPEGKRPLGKSKRRFEDNIKMGLEYKKCVWMWSGFMWLRIKSNSQLL